MVDQRTLLELVLDRLGLDVLAAGEHDGVLRAPDEHEVAALRAHGQVPGVEPAVGVEHGRGGGFVAVVPAHDLGAHKKHALFAEAASLRSSRRMRTSVLANGVPVAPIVLRANSRERIPGAHSVIP